MLMVKSKRKKAAEAARKRTAKAEEAARDRDIEMALEVWDQFLDRSKWKRSKSNPKNVWREWAGCNVSVFRHGGFWKWSIADGDSVRFSCCAYRSVSGAKTALGEDLGLSDIC